MDERSQWGAPPIRSWREDLRESTTIKLKRCEIENEILRARVDELEYKEKLLIRGLYAILLVAVVGAVLLVV